VQEFRKKLIERQVDELEIKLVFSNKSLGKEIIKLLKICTSSIRAFASIILPKRIGDKHKRITHDTHSNKLKKLYGSEVIIKEQTNNIHNLSDIIISKDIRNILSLGLNFHLKSKFDLIKQKAEIENLYTQIENEMKNNEITVTNLEILKCELKRFGLKKSTDFNKPKLTSDQYKKLRKFTQNDKMVIRKADKSNTIVIMNKDDYNSILNDIINDTTKFQKVKDDPSDNIKKK
jgi:hypothetical protein